MMMRDGIMVMQTRDTLHTAKTLVQFVKSMDTLSEKIVIESALGEEVPVENIFAVGAEQDQVLNDLTKRHVKTDHDAVRELWSCFKGVSVESADEYSKHWTLCEIIQGKIPRADIVNFKLANGRKISKNVVASLTTINKAIETKLLSHIEGVSAAMATDLISERSLSALLSYGIEGFAMRKIGKSKRAFGPERAERVLRLFNYKYVGMMQPPEIQYTPISESDLTSLLDDLL